MQLKKTPDDNTVNSSLFRIDGFKETEYAQAIGECMVVGTWESKASDIVYRKFQAGESLVDTLESLARANGIREAIYGGKIQITRCTDNGCQFIYLNLMKQRN